MARYTNTLRLILLAYQQQGKLPYLSAVGTIMHNMLATNGKQPDEATWALFTKVAMLPLLTTKLAPKCVAQGEPCGQRAKTGHCWHGSVELPTTVQLQATDEWLLQRARQRNGAEILSWWGKQLAQALGASYVG